MSHSGSGDLWLFDEPETTGLLVLSGEENAGGRAVRVRLPAYLTRLLLALQLAWIADERRGLPSSEAGWRRREQIRWTMARMTGTEPVQEAAVSDYKKRIKRRIATAATEQRRDTSAWGVFQTDPQRGMRLALPLRLHNTPPWFDALVREVGEGAQPASDGDGADAPGRTGPASDADAGS